MAEVHEYGLSAWSNEALRRLIETSGEKIFEHQGFESVVTEHFASQVSLFLGVKEVSLKERDIREITGISRFLTILFAWVWGRSVEGGFVVRTVDLNRATSRDLKAIFEDRGSFDDLHYGALHSLERQWGRYSISIDGERFSSHLAINDYFMKQFGADKKQVLKALMLISETVCAKTITEAYQKLANIDGSRMLIPQNRVRLTFDTTSLTVTCSEAYSLINVEKRKGITSFRLSQTISLGEKVARAGLHR
ncbi:MAG: hypothetical protein Q8P27_02130 [Candidatus Peregrinibacteria bacterium]|nr:hypothetical protein [Candidatus Peregrinibacteria bacterium]